MFEDKVNCHFMPTMDKKYLDFILFFHTATVPIGLLNCTTRINILVTLRKCQHGPENTLKSGTQTKRKYMICMDHVASLLALPQNFRYSITTCYTFESKATLNSEIL